MRKGTFEIELRMSGLSPEYQVKVSTALTLALQTRWFNQHEEFEQVDNGRWCTYLVNSHDEVTVEVRIFDIKEVGDV